MIIHRKIFILILFGFILITPIMKAQNNSTNQSLNEQQRSLVTISALTASGNLENLKVQFLIISLTSTKKTFPFREMFRLIIT